MLHGGCPQQFEVNPPRKASLSTQTMSMAIYRGSHREVGDDTTEWAAVVVSLFCLAAPIVAMLGGLVLLRSKALGILRALGGHAKMDEMIKALQQLQILLHAENSLTRDTIQSAVDQGAETVSCRVQAVMNKVMQMHEAVGQVSDLIHLLKDRMDVYEGELSKVLAEFKNSSAGGMTKVSASLNSHHVESLKALKDYAGEIKATLQQLTQELGDRVQKETGGFVMDCQKTLQHAILPIKGNQEKFTANVNDRFTEVLKEVANVPYKVSKESKDIQAQVRWTQQTLDRVQSSTDHLPDRLGILRSMLEKIEETLDEVKRSVTPAGEEVRADSPPGSQNPKEDATTGQGERQWTQAAPSSFGPRPNATMLNLDASLPPVQLARPASVLTPVTLADGRVCYIPRSVLQQILGHE